MLAGWDAVYNLVTGNMWAVSATLLTFLAAALAAYARDQIRAGTIWALTPLARYLPWNRGAHRFTIDAGLSSTLTLVHVYLRNVAGSRARYEKTTFFAVSRSTIVYHEAVTAECTAAAFTTMRGTIVNTIVERGFYVSEINLGENVGEGERLTNIYSAELRDSFVKLSEHWTQEFIYPTKHFVLHVHFPDARPPKSLTCKVVDGASEKPSKSTARIVDLFGRKSIVWDVDNPKVNEVLKLEWIW